MTTERDWDEYETEVRLEVDRMFEAFFTEMRGDRDYGNRRIQHREDNASSSDDTEDNPFFADTLHQNY